MKAANDYSGKVAFLDTDYFSGIWDTTGGTTAAHEFGHFYYLNSDQLNTVYSSWKNGNLNKGSNYELHPFWGKRPNKGGRGSAASIYVR